MFTISYSTQDLPGVEVRVTPLDVAGWTDRTGNVPTVCTVTDPHPDSQCDGMWHPHCDSPERPELHLEKGTVGYHRQTVVDGHVVHSSIWQGAGGPDYAAVCEACIAEFTGGPRTYPLCLAIWEHRALVARR